MLFLKELINFLLTRKKYWLIPIFFILLLFGGVFVVSTGSVLSPAIYAIF